MFIFNVTLYSLTMLLSHARHNKTGAQKLITVVFHPKIKRMKIKNDIYFNENEACLQLVIRICL